MISDSWYSNLLVGVGTYNRLFSEADAIRHYTGLKSQVLGVEVDGVPASCAGGFSCARINYTEDVTPILTSIKPSIGSTGTNITLTGRALNGTALSVEIGGAQCAVFSVSEIEIQCTVTTVLPGLYDVVATFGHRASAFTLAQPILFACSAQAHSVFPGSGSMAGGTGEYCPSGSLSCRTNQTQKQCLAFTASWHLPRFNSHCADFAANSVSNIWKFSWSPQHCSLT